MPKCEQNCGAKATVYAMGPRAGDWAGRYCEPCAKELGFTITDRLPVPPAIASAHEEMERQAEWRVSIANSTVELLRLALPSVAQDASEGVMGAKSLQAKIIAKLEENA